MAGDKRQFGCQFGMGYDTVILQLSAEQIQCSKSNPVQIDRLRFEIGAFKQGADALQHLAGTVAVTDNQGHGRPHFIEIGGRLVEPEYSRIAVYRDSCQWLSDLVSDGTRNCVDVHKLIIALTLQHHICASEARLALPTLRK